LLTDSPIKARSSPSLAAYLSLSLANTEKISSVHWPSLVQKAINHRVIPSLYQVLSTDFVDCIPADLLAQLKQLNHQQALRSIALTGELLNLLEHLATHNIPAIAYKGPVLSMLAYGSISARAFDDLDILVHPQDFFQPKIILQPYGYEAQLLDMLSPRQEKVFFEHLGEYLMVNSETDIHLDIHCRSVAGDGFAKFLDLNCFWDRLQPLQLMNRSIQTFCLEDFVLFICIGAGKDGWPYLKQVCDLASLIQNHPHLNWDQVLSEAKRLKMENILRIGLLLVHILLHLPLSDRLLKFAHSSRTARWISHRIAQRLDRDQPPLTTDPSLERFLVRWIMLDHWPHKIAYIQAKLSWKMKLLFMVNDLDHQVLTLPRPLYFLYYGIRPIRLLYKHRDRLRLNF
jgi:Uncharacterised nucleotidyltransferase